jgi:hypothetical protein
MRVALKAAFMLSLMAITEVGREELRVCYNHSERKNHTKSFAKTLSHWPKPLFFSFTPSF